MDEFITEDFYKSGSGNLSDFTTKKYSHNWIDPKIFEILK